MSFNEEVYHRARSGDLHQLLRSHLWSTSLVSLSSTLSNFTVIAKML